MIKTSNLLLIILSLVMIIFGSVAILYFPFIKILFADFFNEGEQVLQTSSPDGKYSILVTSEPPAFHPYASHGVSIYQIANQPERQKIFSTSIKNDGANLGDDNVILSWQSSETALLKLDGEEQESVCYQITVGKKTKYMQITCEQ